MQDMNTIPSEILDCLARRGCGAVIGVRPLRGGEVSAVACLQTARGGSFVLKTSHQLPPDMYACEAEALAAIRVPGGPMVPAVFHVSERCLLLEYIASAPRASGYWRDFGRGMAVLHSCRHAQYGFPRDNYAGRVKVDNTFTDDGYGFYARTRILHFLALPLCGQTLTQEERRGIERLAARLPELIPPQPPSLLHGDLWENNILVTADGGPALIDPHAFYGWAEADIAMLATKERHLVPDAFFQGYDEVRPLQPGWGGRMEIYALREHLINIAHFGMQTPSVAIVRALLAKYA